MLLYQSHGLGNISVTQSKVNIIRDKCQFTKRIALHNDCIDIGKGKRHIIIGGESKENNSVSSIRIYAYIYCYRGFVNFFFNGKTVTSQRKIV
ncbi:MAG: hypothetical protein TE42_07000 [Candidatus Synechococcus spongiarum SP3]|uniref:Uncharacterized protein n=1 Tax=Candidatus Synechococcus spongiarum SP3 TaxID=1604020 RepID=A0A0G2HLF2_9SYNE|nr:MAG: hypothetical protein TE42_07000 [Candidatus Synechococcus spongiarum SP3]